MEQFIFENEIESMRARDLKNLLVQRLGVDSALVNKILDREELRKLVTSVMYEKLQQKSKDEFNRTMFLATLAVGVLTVLFMYRKVIWKAMQSIMMLH